ncbi:hypothetical protein SCB17_000931 [Clostridium perfringens]|nr:hypothetical protein [Clostridium perfringens]
MEYKSKNIKTLVWVIVITIILFLGIAYISSKFFYIDYYFQYKDWMISLVSLAGALVGGIITMFGVVLTLNRSISEKEELNRKEKEKLEKEKKEELKITALQVYHEIKAYIESVKNYNLKVLELKLKYGLNDSCDGDEFEKECKKWTWINDLYFMSDDVKDLFYKLVSENVFENKDKMIKTYISINTNHERTKRVFYSEARRSIELMNNMGCGILKYEFIKYRNDVYLNITEENYNMIILNPAKSGPMYRLTLNLKKQLEKFKNENIVIDDINTLLNELNRVYENNAK